MNKLERLQKDVADAGAAYEDVFNDTYDGCEDAWDCYETYMVLKGNAPYNAECAFAFLAWESAKKALDDYLKQALADYLEEQGE